MAVLNEHIELLNKLIYKRQEEAVEKLLRLMEK